MFCPKCGYQNQAGANTCVQCQQVTHYVRERVFIGQQFLFVQGDAEHPVTLKIDDVLETDSTPAIL